MTSQNLPMDILKDDHRANEERPSLASADRREVLKIGGGLVLGLGAGALIGHEPAVHAQPVTYASWIHGHTAHIEFPDRVRRITYLGFHVDIEPRAGSLNWVHFGIPTPVIVNNQRLRILRVILNFSTASVDAFVSNVHVWDAATRIAIFDGLGLSGNRPNQVFAIPGTPSVFNGIGISIGIAAGVEPLDHRFFFRSVGAEFTV
ncbi:MAG: hypothetical protein RMM98_14415 [Acidobacteriota bacterium]|nr:hypothetical protein [Blastocatellia bacterium]MDW8240799.1 hypothetical protein [Acidobacteriota bacterium]